MRAALRLQALGVAALGGAGLWLLVSGESVGAGFSGTLEPRLGADPLTGLFLALLGAVAVPSLLVAESYLGNDARGRAVTGLTGAFLLALALVLCARDPLTFLFGWELITLLSAAAILVWRRADRGARDTVFTYLAVTHLGGVGTWAAVLLLAREDAFGPGGGLETGSALQVAIALAALVGMGTKAGVMPFHVWLPRAHPLAPAPLSALMSGAMVKVALYGLVRVLVEWVGVLPVWLGGVVVLAGAASAVGGVLYATLQPDLKRLLALSTIENVGIVVVGLGAALLLRARGDEEWAAFALAAALLHAANHALFKALLFLGAGAIEHAAGALHVDRLGGLLRRLPWTGGAFLVGAAAIAGVPPLNGFASEWLTLRALVELPLSGGAGDAIAGAAALAALAATAALGVFCFVRVIGLVLLGPPRTAGAAAATEPPRATRAALVALAAACVALGAAPGLLFQPLAELAPWAGDAPVHAGFELPGTGSLPSPALLLVLAGGAAALLLLRGTRSAAPAPTWASGQRVVPELGWTSAGFTKPLQLVLQAVLRPQREVAVHVEGGVVRAVAYDSRVPHLLEERIYAPLAALSLAGAHHARRLQSGSLGTYVAYLAGLVLALLLAARLGWLG